jgi:hypothetical protein
VLVGGDDGDMIAVAFDADRSAWARRLNGEREEEWTALGSIDEPAPNRVPGVPTARGT